MRKTEQLHFVKRYLNFLFILWKWKSEIESQSVVSDSATKFSRPEYWSGYSGNTQNRSLSLLQEIFPTQGLNSGLLHCRHSLPAEHKGSPRILEWVAYPFHQRIFLNQELNQGLLCCRQILNQLNYLGSSITSVIKKWRNMMLWGGNCFSFSVLAQSI